jgi:hypothetical protein
VAGLDPAIFFSAEENARIERRQDEKNDVKLWRTVNEPLTVTSPHSTPNESTE